ncbi:hypothetical protein POM88_039169 [Heracleum sosnowskyi]|uniref:Uncharacterized protein n=1 Tax=Heracleum sosnowskyi TaxID=360622 RepID=A0AAD8HBS4_9APIA|nr:hypothetical protein POM88_039169 [Heracleum sosnowskyi]
MNTTLSSITLDIGSADKICCDCEALMRRFEQTEKQQQLRSDKFSLCCGSGKVRLPLLRETPPELKSLLDGTNCKSTIFQNNSRLFNSALGFTSVGANMDKSINNGGGPFVYRLHGVLYHQMGSLFPQESKKAVFSQIYIVFKIKVDLLLEDLTDKHVLGKVIGGVSTKSVQGEIVLWSSSSTQFFFDIEHPALLTLRENPNMKDNKILTLAPIINNPMQAVASNIDIVTINQLFDAQLPNGAKNASPDIIPPVLNNMLRKTYKFKVTLTSYNTVRKLEGYTVSDIEEVKSLESEKPKSDADAGTPKGQLDREIKEPSESPMDNKRKLLDLSPPDKTSKIDSGVALDDDTTDQANNGDQSPATPTGMKKKTGRQNNKRQK